MRTNIIVDLPLENQKIFFSHNWQWVECYKSWFGGYVLAREYDPQKHCVIISSTTTELLYCGDCDLLFIPTFLHVADMSEDIIRKKAYKIWLENKNDDSKHNWYLAKHSFRVFNNDATSNMSKDFFMSCEERQIREIVE